MPPPEASRVIEDPEARPRPGPRSVNRAVGSASRCQMMTRMERATAAWALALPRRRAILEYHSPTKVTVRRRRQRPARGIRVATPWPFLPARAWGPDWRADMMPPRRVVVCLEVTPKQAVASALDWPGWCRVGRDEDAALTALASYAGRYAPVAAHAGLSFPAAVAFDVAERVPGGPATAFADRK